MSQHGLMREGGGGWHCVDILRVHPEVVHFIRIFFKVTEIVYTYLFLIEFLTIFEK